MFLCVKFLFSSFSLLVVWDRRKSGEEKKKTNIDIENKNTKKTKQKKVKTDDGSPMCVHTLHTRSRWAKHRPLTASRVCLCVYDESQTDKQATLLHPRQIMTF